MATNAQHQASYRARQATAGSVRLDTHISADAHAALTTLAKREGATVRAVVETAILNTHEGRHMQTQFRRDDPATDPVVTPVSNPARKDTAPMSTPAPARPTSMTAAETAELERFKEQLPKAFVAAEQDARRVQANGGAAAMEQKERVTAAFLASNIHRR